MVSRRKLTKLEVDSIPASPEGQIYYWDRSLPGFGLRVGAKAKSYFAEGRVKGRVIRYTIGRHGVWTAEKAREEARNVLQIMSKGINPNDEKQREKARSVTLGEAFDDYLASHRLKALTVRDYKSVMQGPLRDWQSRPLVSITKDMISRRHAKQGAASQARANLSMRVLRAVFNYAIARYEDDKGRRIIPTNPVGALSDTRTWFKVDRRQTVIKAHDLARWYQAVTDLQGQEPGQKRGVVRDYLLLLLFTGLRRGEAATLQWKDVDFSDRTLTVRDTKNRDDHTLPMSDFVFQLLKVRDEEIQKRAAAGGDEEKQRALYVFPGEGKGGHIVEPRKQMARVIKTSGVDFTLHDLRRTFTTIAESLDVPAYAIKRLLNHTMKNDVTAGYVVMDVERLREPMQKISAYILAAADAQPSARVLKMARTAAERS